MNNCVVVRTSECHSRWSRRLPLQSLVLASLFTYNFRFDYIQILFLNKFLYYEIISSKLLLIYTTTFFLFPGKYKVECW